MASSEAAAANTRMRYMTTNAGVRTASPGEYCRTAGTLLRRLRFTRLSMAHSLGSISGGHQPGGGSRKRAPHTATTRRTHTPTPAKISARFPGVRTAAKSAMNGTAP